MWPIILGSALVAFVASRKLTRFKANPGPVKFSSQFSLTDSVERLSLACLPYEANTLAFRWLVGNVSKAHVRLECKVRKMQNSFKPIFNGYFLEEDGEIVLKGAFAMATSTRIFMFLWDFGMVSVLGLLVSQLGVHHGPDQLEGIIFTIALIAAATFTTRSGMSFAADDIEWISKSITSILQPPFKEST